MESKRGILTVLIITAVVVLASLPCSIAQDNSDRDQPPDSSRIQRPGGPRQGPGSGDRDGRRGPGGDRQGRGGRPGRPDERWRRPELSDEQIDSVLEELKKRDPNTAKELADLRQKYPNEFRSELRRAAGQEIGKIIIESWREIQRKEFLEWLEKYVPKEAEPLTKLKESNPKLYAQKFELVWEKYRPIYDLARRSPELTPVLIEDMQLTERENELVKKIKVAKNEQEKTDLMTQLEKVEFDKYDLIVRRKQIEYEELLKRLQALQNEVKASLADIDEWRNEKVKAERVEERVDDLTSERGRRFRWR